MKPTAILTAIAAATTLAIGSARAQNLDPTVRDSYRGPIINRSLASGFELDLGGVYLIDNDALALDIAAGWHWAGSSRIRHFIGIAALIPESVDESDGFFSLDANLAFIHALWRGHVQLGRENPLWFYGEAGLGLGYSDVSVDAGGRNVLDDDNFNFSVRGGLGLELELTPKIGLQLGWTIVYADLEVGDGLDAGENVDHGPRLAVAVRF